MITDYPAHLDEKVKASFNQFSEVAMENSAINVLFNVGTSNDYSKGYTSVEGGTGVDYFTEGANLDAVNNEEGYNSVGVSQEFGGLITISKKEMLNARDETTLFNKIVDTKVPVLMSDMYNFIEQESMKMLNDGFSTALAPDGVEIFGTHTWNSTSNTFANRSATNIAAGEAALTELEAYAGDFKDANDKPMPMSPKTLVAKKRGSASVEFRKVLADSGHMVAETIGNVNIYNNGDYTLIESPFITSSTAWYAFDSRQQNPLIVDFIQVPKLEERWTNPKNLTQETPASGSFRTGAFEMPTSWYGSDGTGT